jgi:hypothetical protein
MSHRDTAAVEGGARQHRGGEQRCDSLARLAGRLRKTSHEHFDESQISAFH